MALGVGFDKPNEGGRLLLQRSDGTARDGLERLDSQYRPGPRPFRFPGATHRSVHQERGVGLRRLGVEDAGAVLLGDDHRPPAVDEEGGVPCADEPRRSRRIGGRQGSAGQVDQLGAVGTAQPSQVESVARHRRACRQEHRPTRRRRQWSPDQTRRGSGATSAPTRVLRRHPMAPTIPPPAGSDRRDAVPTCPREAPGPSVPRCRTTPRTPARRERRRVPCGATPVRRAWPGSRRCAASRSRPLSPLPP